MDKKLYRSEEHRVIAGVCGGIAEYFETDPLIVRLLFLFTILFGAISIFIYLFLWIVIPEKGKTSHAHDYMHMSKNSQHEHHAHGVFGFFLIIVGVLFLIDNLFPGLGLRTFWPLILIFLGLVIMMRKHDHEHHHHAHHTTNTTHHGQDE